MMTIFAAIDMLMDRFRGERGDWNIGGGFGLVAFVIIVLFILWLTESSGKTNFFE